MEEETMILAEFEDHEKLQFPILKTSRNRERHNCIGCKNHGITK